MKITNKSWQLPVTKESMSEAVAYSKKCGLNWHREQYDANCPCVWCYHSSGALTHARYKHSSINITLDQFKAMCDEYAANMIAIPQKKEASKALNERVAELLSFVFKDEGPIPQSKMNNGQYYCLLEGGTAAPRAPHPSLEAAKVEARRLVEVHGKPVRILRAELEVAPGSRYIETQL